jgi:hypothetical protein
MMRTVRLAQQLPNRVLTSKSRYTMCAHKGGGGAAYRAAVPTRSPRTEILKNTDFVDIGIAKVLRALLSSRNRLMTNMLEF